MDDRESVRAYLTRAEQAFAARDYWRAGAAAAIARAFAAAAGTEPEVRVKTWVPVAFDLIDRDGDRWEFDAGRVRWFTHQGDVTVWEHREAVEEKFGPVTEVPR